MTAEIRLFKPEDRALVRRIFLATADAGRPLGDHFPDAEILADLWTRYYMEDEPQSLWVAEDGGRVVGYLTGCADEARFARVMWQRIIPQALWKALKRGLFCMPAFWRLLWTNRDLLPMSFRKDSFLTRYPGHFHLNLAESHRRQGLGRTLIMHFLDKAKADGCPGVRAATREDNLPIHRLLETLGFQHLARQPTFRWTHEPEKKWKIIYGRTL